MKVLDLQCGHGHIFEAWFASELDFQHQLEKGLLSCPVCDEPQVTKLPSAPRLQLGSRHHNPSTPSSSPTAKAEHDPRRDLQAAWLAWSHQIASQTEDVGTDFPDLARQMHEGDIPERAIRGESTLEQVRALLDDGIPVVPLAIPPASKKTLQ